MSRRTQRATALALSALLIPALTGCIMQAGDTDETTTPETTEVEETDTTTSEPVEETDEAEETEESEETETVADGATFTDADDFLSQFESEVETCLDTQVQDVEELVGDSASAMGLSGATMGSCVLGTSGDFVSAVVLEDPSASVNDIEAKAPGFLKGLLDGAQGDTLVVGGNWVIFGKGAPEAEVIAAFGGEAVTP